MRILWINNEGGGFADYVVAAEGTTVEQFFQKQLPGCKPENYVAMVRAAHQFGAY